MLSPVSPSATGNTFRSLTSCRRASRWASAPSTALRKRTRLVAATAARLFGHLGGLGDLARLQAARADVHAPGSPAIVDADLLEVGLEAPLGGHHRVAAAVAERGALAAGMTDLGHRVREYRYRAVDLGRP